MQVPLMAFWNWAEFPAARVGSCNRQRRNSAKKQGLQGQSERQYLWKSGFSSLFQGLAALAPKARATFP
jgi:hypothetical protein